MNTASLTNTIRAKKVLIDTNIIIYLTGSIEPYASISRQLFNMVESGEVDAVFSILTIGEVMQGPIRKGRFDVANEIREYLINFPNSHCQEISQPVLEIVGKDNRITWNKLRTADSLIIASGLLNDVDFFLSNDAHFSKAIPSDMLVSFHALRQ